MREREREAKKVVRPSVREVEKEGRKELIRSKGGFYNAKRTGGPRPTGVRGKKLNGFGLWI